MSFTAKRRGFSDTFDELSISVWPRQICLAKKKKLLCEAGKRIWTREHYVGQENVCGSVKLLWRCTGACHCGCTGLHTRLLLSWKVIYQSGVVVQDHTLWRSHLPFIVCAGQHREDWFITFKTKHFFTFYTWKLVYQPPACSSIVFCNGMVLSDPYIGILTQYKIKLREPRPSDGVGDGVISSWLPCYTEDMLGCLFTGQSNTQRQTHVAQS